MGGSLAQNLDYCCCYQGTRLSVPLLCCLLRRYRITSNTWADLQLVQMACQPELVKLDVMQRDCHGCLVYKLARKTLPQGKQTQRLKSNVRESCSNSQDTGSDTEWHWTDARHPRDRCVSDRTMTSGCTADGSSYSTARIWADRPRAILPLWLFILPKQHESKGTAIWSWFVNILWSI